LHHAVLVFPFNIKKIKLFLQFKIMRAMWVGPLCSVICSQR